MNTKTTMIMAVMAAVVAVYLFFVEKPWEKPLPVETPKTTAKALFEPKPKDIDRVEMVDKGNKLVFKKENNAWMMLEPMQAPAAEFEVNAIVDKVGDIKYMKEYPKDDKNRPKEAVAGLDKPVTVKLFKGEKPEVEILVGGPLPTGKGSYVRLAGSDKILETQAELKDVFGKRVESYRDKRVVKFEPKDAKRVKVEGLQNFELAQSNNEWVVESPTRGRGDKARIDRIVNALSTLNAQDWKDDKVIKAYGFDRPSLKITVETVKEIPAKAKPGDPDTKPADTQPSIESKTTVLLVGGAADAATFFAKLDSAPWVFSIPEHTFKELSPQLSELRDKQIAKIDAANITKIEAETPGGSMTLTRQDRGEWHFADGTVADSAAVQDLLKAVQVRATEFVGPNDPMLGFDWSKPRAKVTFTQRDLVQVTLLVGQGSTSGKMVYVRTAAEDSVAVVREDEVAQLLAPPAAYRDRNVMTFFRDNATRLEVTRSGSEPVVLAKKVNKWLLEQPVAGAADADSVRNVLADLSSLRAKRVVSTGEDQAKYGLNAPGVILAVTIETPPPATRPAAATKPAQTAATKPAAQAAATQPAGRSVDDQIKGLESLLQYQREHPAEEKPELTATIRKKLEDLRATTQPAAAQAGAKPAVTQPAQAEAPKPPDVPPPKVFRLRLSQRDGATYASVEDKPTIYELDNKVYDDTTAEMHDRQIMKFELANVADLEFEHGETKIQLHKSGEDWKFLQDSTVPIDNQKVNDVLNAFRELKTHRYVSYTAADPEKHQLDKDVDRVAVSLNGGEKMEIRLSKKGPEGDADKSRYATLGTGKGVFLLKSDQAGKFAQKLEDFEKGSGAKPPAAPPGELPAGVN